jgi:hypothetical protein
MIKQDAAVAYAKAHKAHNLGPSVATKAGVIAALEEMKKHTVHGKLPDDICAMFKEEMKRA